MILGFCVPVPAFCSSIAGSSFTWFPPGPPGPLQSSFPAGWPPAYPGAWGCSSQHNQAQPKTSPAIPRSPCDPPQEPILGYLTPASTPHKHTHSARPPPHTHCISTHVTCLHLRRFPCPGCLGPFLDAGTDGWMDGRTQTHGMHWQILHHPRGPLEHPKLFSFLFIPLLLVTVLPRPHQDHGVRGVMKTWKEGGSNGWKERRREA